MGSTTGERARPRRPQRDNGYRHQSRYGVIVLCDDESHHRRVYEELAAAGYRCRVVCV